MQYRFTFILLLPLLLLSACKDIPVFDPAQNDPNTPEYKVRKAYDFAILRNYLGNSTARLFIRPNLNFPFHGAKVEAGTGGQFHPFLDIPISRMNEEKVFEIEMFEIPYLETDYRLRMYYVLNGDTLFSETDTTKLYQSLFDFKIERSEDQYIVSFRNNFIDQSEVNFYTKRMDSLVYLGSTSLLTHSERFNSVSIDSFLLSPTDDIYYQINSSSDPDEELIPISFEKNGCIQQIGTNTFFVPENLSFRFNESAEEGIFNWDGDCDYDELHVYWNIHRGYQDYYEYLPMQELHRTTEITNEIDFFIKWNVPRSVLWITAVKDGVETELALFGVAN